MTFGISFSYLSKNRRILSPPKSTNFNMTNYFIIKNDIYHKDFYLLHAIMFGHIHYMYHTVLFEYSITLPVLSL